MSICTLRCVAPFELAFSLADTCDTRHTYGACCGVGCSEIAVESGGKEFVGSAGRRSKTGAAGMATGSICITMRQYMSTGVLEFYLLTLVWYNILSHVTDMQYKTNARLRESHILALSGREGKFTQPSAHL